MGHRKNHGDVSHNQRLIIQCHCQNGGITGALTWLAAGDGWWVRSRICVFLCALLHISMGFLDENPVFQIFADELFMFPVFSNMFLRFFASCSTIWLGRLRTSNRSNPWAQVKEAWDAKTGGVADLSRNVQEISKMFVVFNMNGGWDQLYWNLWYIIFM
jgi:hypothetical protein